MTAHLRDQLGQFGIWRGAVQVTALLAAEIEQFGFGALWLGGSPDGDLDQVEELLNATSTIMLGTSIVNIWKDDPHHVARSLARLRDRHPGRFVLGVGAGHRKATPQYERPYAALAAYVDALRGDGVRENSRTCRAWPEGGLARPANARQARSHTWCRPSTPARRGRSWARSRCSRPSTRWCLILTPRVPGRSAGSGPHSVPEPGQLHQ